MTNKVKKEIKTQSATYSRHRLVELTNLLRFAPSPRWTTLARTHLVSASILQADGANRWHFGVIFFLMFLGIGAYLSNALVLLGKSFIVAFLQGPSWGSLHQTP